MGCPHGSAPADGLATAVFGVGLVELALSNEVGLSLVFMLLTGMGMMVQMAASNTILQTIIEEDKRGRVMRFYSVAFLGMAPFGSLFAGSLAGWIGAAGTVLVGGVACLVGAALFAARLPRLRERVRPIYVRMGILSAVASGLHAAVELTRLPEE